MNLFLKKSHKYGQFSTIFQIYTIKKKNSIKNPICFKISKYFFENLCCYRMKTKKHKNI